MQCRRLSVSVFLCLLQSAGTHKSIISNAVKTCRIVQLLIQLYKFIWLQRISFAEKIINFKTDIIRALKIRKYVVRNLTLSNSTRWWYT